MPQQKILKGTQDKYTKAEFMEALSKCQLSKGQFVLDVDESENIKLSKIKKYWIQKEDFTGTVS